MSGEWQLLINGALRQRTNTFHSATIFRFTGRGWLSPTFTDSVGFADVGSSKLAISSLREPEPFPESSVISSVLSSYREQICPNRYARSGQFICKEALSQNLRESNAKDVSWFIAIDQIESANIGLREFSLYNEIKIKEALLFWNIVDSVVKYLSGITLQLPFSYYVKNLTAQQSLATLFNSV